MKPILLIYATREGHTRRIAEHVGALLAAQQRTFELVDAAHLPSGFSLAKYGSAIRPFPKPSIEAAHLSPRK